MPVYGNHKFRNVYTNFSIFYFVILILFSGLRWQTGTDWDPYIEYFTTQDNYRFFELGYVLLTALIKTFTDSYTVFLLIDAALALIPVWWVMKKENGCNPLSLAIFVPYYYTVNYLGSNRRIIAMGLCMLALIPLQNRKLKHFIILCMLAFCFHRSASVFLLAWPIFHGRPGKKGYAILAACIISMAIWNPIVHLLPMIPGNSGIVIVQRLLTYSSNNNINPTTNYALQDSLSLAKRGAFLLLIAFGLSKVTGSEKSKYTGYINLYLASLFLYVLFTGTVEIFKVITLYFSIVEIFLIPRAISTVSKGLRPILYAVFILFLIAQQYSALVPYWDLYVPYRSVLTGSM
jgi:hypothetical protein